MSPNLQLVTNGSSLAMQSEEQFVTFSVAGQMLGLPALQVKDVLRQQPITRVPLTRSEIVGAMNLRGHIIPAIGMDVRLNGQEKSSIEDKMCIVVEGRNETVCLIVDTVGEVLTLKTADIDPNPGALISSWAQFASGVYRADGQLILILDVDQVLDLQ